MKNGLGKLIRWALRLLGFLMLLVLLTNVVIIASTSDQVYHHIDDLPARDVGLVLGTSHKLLSGDSNQFFQQRIELAVQLFEAGKVKHLLVSGDNSTRYYNEPMNMRNALISKGIPPEAISRDFAGFRTLDSIVRCKEVFGQEEVIVITQTFHSYRALFIGNHHDMTITALVSEDLPFWSSAKVKLREVLARTVAVYDLFIVNTRPKFLGEEIPIPVQ